MSNNKHRTSSEYLAIKNFLHNECGLTKEEIKAAAHLAIRDAATSEVRRYMQSEKQFYQMELLVTKVLREALIGSAYTRNEFRDQLLKKASEVVANQLTLNIKEPLKVVPSDLQSGEQ